MRVWCEWCYVCRVGPVKYTGHRRSWCKLISFSTGSTRYRARGRTLRVGKKSKVKPYRIRRIRQHRSCVL